ncbi:MAG: hypothetical protein ABJ013_09435 [Halioglobus sp.]
MKIKKTFGMAALGLLAMLPLSSIAADSLSAKGSLVCASIHVLACDADNHCMQGPPSSFEVPYFMFVDFDKKEVRATSDEGNIAISPIKESHVTDQAIILQGFENGRGWTLAVGRADGKLSLASAGADIHFAISGNCTEM